jgi:hypothetical protein
MSRFLARVVDYVPFSAAPTLHAQNNNSNNNNNNKNSSKKKKQDLPPGFDLASLAHDAMVSSALVDTRQPAAVLLVVSASFLTAVVPWIVSDNDRGLSAKELAFFQKIPTFQFATSLTISRISLHTEDGEHHCIAASALRLLRPQLNRFRAIDCPLHPSIIDELVASPHLDQFCYWFVCSHLPPRESIVELSIAIERFLRQHNNPRLHSILGEVVALLIGHSGSASAELHLDINQAFAKFDFFAKYQQRMIQVCHSDFTLLPSFIHGLGGIIENRNRVVDYHGNMNDEQALELGRFFEVNARHSVENSGNKDPELLRTILATKDAFVRCHRHFTIDDVAPTLDLIEEIVLNGDFAKYSANDTTLQIRILQFIATLAPYRNEKRAKEFVEQYGATLLPRMLRDSIAFGGTTSTSAEASNLVVLFATALNNFGTFSRDNLWTKYSSSRADAAAMIASGRRALAHFPFDVVSGALKKILDEKIVLSPRAMQYLATAMSSVVIQYERSAAREEPKSGLGAPPLFESGIVDLFLMILAAPHNLSGLSEMLPRVIIVEEDTGFENVDHACSEIKKWIKNIDQKNPSSSTASKNKKSKINKNVEEEEEFYEWLYRHQAECLIRSGSAMSVAEISSKFARAKIQELDELYLAYQKEFERETKIQKEIIKEKHLEIDFLVQIVRMSRKQAENRMTSRPTPAKTEFLRVMDLAHNEFIDVQELLNNAIWVISRRFLDEDTGRWKSGVKNNQNDDEEDEEMKKKVKEFLVAVKESIEAVQKAHKHFVLLGKKCPEFQPRNDMLSESDDDDADQFDFDEYDEFEDRGEDEGEGGDFDQNYYDDDDDDDDDEESFDPLSMLLSMISAGTRRTRGGRPAAAPRPAPKKQNKAKTTTTKKKQAATTKKTQKKAATKTTAKKNAKKQTQAKKSKKAAAPKKAAKKPSAKKSQSKNKKKK